jgi:hypothetical protein
MLISCICFCPCLVESFKSAQCPVDHEKVQYPRSHSCNYCTSPFPSRPRENSGGSRSYWWSLGSCGNQSMGHARRQPNTKYCLCKNRSPDCISKTHTVTHWKYAFIHTLRRPSTHLPATAQMHLFAFTTLTTALVCATAQLLVPSVSVIDITLVTSTSADTATTQVLVHSHNKHSRTSVPSTFITSASASSTAAETIAALTEWRKGIQCPNGPNAGIFCPAE